MKNEQHYAHVGDLYIAPRTLERLRLCAVAFNRWIDTQDPSDLALAIDFRDAAERAARGIFRKR